MKIVVWNIRNVSLGKLNKALSPTFRAFGLGNTVLDYIINVAMGADQWEEVISDEPPDLFVVVEVVSGGTAKGSDVSGECIPTLNAICNGLNTYIANSPRHVPADYSYLYAIPKVAGYHETMGFFFNQRVLTLQSFEVQRNLTTNQYLTGKTPVAATFAVNNKPNTTIKASAIHAPPLGKTTLTKMRNPIDFCRQLFNTSTAAAPNAMFMGDFNCQPADSYTNGHQVVVLPFSNLGAIGFSSKIPNGTWTSVRKTYKGTLPQPTDYMSASYDNIISHLAPNIVIQDQDVPDLIGEAKNVNVDPITNLYPGNVVATLNAYNLVSDHYPVIFEIAML